MMMVLGGIGARIKSLLPELTASGQKIANFILTHPRDVLNMTIHEVADQSGTSGAAVTRFCRSIGLTGFSELKVHLSADQVAFQMDQTGYLDIEPNEPVDSILRKTINNSLQAIRETESYLDLHAIEQAVKAVQQASVVYVYGVGASSIVAEDVAQKWLRVGKSSFAITNRHLLAMTLASAPQDALFFAISYSGNTKDVIELTKVAKEVGLQTMGLSRFGTSELSELVDLMLYTAHAPEAKLRSAATSSRLAQLLVIDVLFFVYGSTQFDQTIKQLSKTSDAIKHFQSE